MDITRLNKLSEEEGRKQNGLLNFSLRKKVFNYISVRKCIYLISNF